MSESTYDINHDVIHRMRVETTQFVGKGADEITNMVRRGLEIKELEGPDNITHLSELDLNCLNTASLYELFRDEI